MSFSTLIVHFSNPHTAMLILQLINLPSLFVGPTLIVLN